MYLKRPSNISHGQKHILLPKMECRNNGRKKKLIVDEILMFLFVF